MLGLKSLIMPRLKILAYHGIPQSNPSAYEVSSVNFREQMEIIRQSGFSVLDLDDAISRLKQRTLSGRNIVITFDDAHETVEENAVPILARHNFTATIFVPTGLAGKQDNFSGPGHEYKGIMDWEKLMALKKQGFRIGSHTVNHSDLRTLDDRALKYELDSSLSDMKTNLGDDLYYLAYPFGLLDERIKEFTKLSGFKGGLCFGSVLSNWELTDLYELKREKVLSSTSPAQFKRIIDPSYDLFRAASAFISRKIL